MLDEYALVLHLGPDVYAGRKTEVARWTPLPQWPSRAVDHGPTPADLLPAVRKAPTGWCWQTTLSGLVWTLPLAVVVPPGGKV